MPCSHSALLSIGHLPHPWSWWCLPGAQELCTSLGSAKGSDALGLLPFSGRQKPTKTSEAPGVQFPAQSIKQTLTAAEKNPWLLETSVQLWVELVKQNEFPAFSASFIITAQNTTWSNTRSRLSSGEEKKKRGGLPSRT